MEVVEQLEKLPGYSIFVWKTHCKAEGSLFVYQL